MKPNQKNRYNGRYNNRNNRSMIMRNTALESSGPAGKLHGTALQLFEKYQAAAKDAMIQNDLVLAQTYLQYADHYIRLQNIAIANEQMLRGQMPNNNMNNISRAEEVIAETPAEESDSLPVFELPSDTNETSADVDSVPAAETLHISAAENGASADTPAVQKKPAGRVLHIKHAPKENINASANTATSQTDAVKSMADTVTAAEPVVQAPVVQKVIRRGRPRVKSAETAVESVSQSAE